MERELGCAMILPSETCIAFTIPSKCLNNQISGKASLYFSEVPKQPVSMKILDFRITDEYLAIA
jgi:hypothetical protein